MLLAWYLVAFHCHPSRNALARGICLATDRDMICWGKAEERINYAIIADERFFCFVCRFFFIAKSLKCFQIKHFGISTIRIISLGGDAKGRSCWKQKKCRENDIYRRIKRKMSSFCRRSPTTENKKSCTTTEMNRTHRLWCAFLGFGHKECLPFVLSFNLLTCIAIECQLNADTHSNVHTEAHFKNAISPFTNCVVNAQKSDSSKKALTFFIENHKTTLIHFAI